MARIILIVDDEKDLRTIIRTKLESSGFDVRDAENGKEALEMMRKEKPDLVIMDIKMPIMNGVEAVSEMKGDNSLKDIRVIFLTNFGEEDVKNTWIDEKYAKEIGALGYIRKTDDLNIIVEKVKELAGS